MIDALTRAARLPSLETPEYQYRQTKREARRGAAASLPRRPLVRRTQANATGYGVVVEQDAGLNFGLFCSLNGTGYATSSPYVPPRK